MPYMIPLPRIIVEGYRCFADRTELRLAPLTLLYGWNHAGKTSLLRLLPLIADSVAESAREPLAIIRAFDSKVTFPDLIWNRSVLPNITLELQFAAEQELAKARFLVRFEKLDDRAYIRELELFDSQGKTLLFARHIPKGDTPTLDRAYEVTVPGKKPTEQEITFEGLVPVAFPKQHKKLWSGLRTRLELLRGSVGWLRSPRGQLERIYPKRGSFPIVLSADGSDAVDVLRGDPGILKAVSSFYETHFQQKLLCGEIEQNFYLRLQSMADSSVVNMVDAGQGLQQVLPILVAAELSRRHDGGRSSILAIEEPDANLHENAQRWLGEYLCKLAAAENPPSLVLETHSQTLMLAIQLAVARGELPRDRVQLYWVCVEREGRGFAAPVTLNERGFPVGMWPDGVFADKNTLAREILLAGQMKR